MSLHGRRVTEKDKSPLEVLKETEENVTSEVLILRGLFLRLSFINEA